MRTFQHLVLAASALVVVHSGMTAVLHDESSGEPIELIFRVNRRAEVDIGVDLHAGEIILKRGKYIVSHRIEGETHVIALTHADRNELAADPIIIELESRLFAFDEVVERSALIAKEQDDHSYRLVSVQLLGENGDHAFIRARTNPKHSL